jgi:MFS family permease
VARDDWTGSAHDDPDTIAEPEPERPWLLIALAAACIVAAIAGALGPWFRYERISEGSTHTWTTPGYQSSGFFIIIFATAALVALGVALLRDRAEPLAWVAFIGMALCTVIVIGVWTDPPQQTIPYGGAGTNGRLGWGPMVAGIAAPLGALFLFLTARRLTTREV